MTQDQASAHAQVGVRKRRGIWPVVRFGALAVVAFYVFLLHSASFAADVEPREPTAEGTVTSCTPQWFYLGMRSVCHIRPPDRSPIEDREGFGDDADSVLAPERQLDGAGVGDRIGLTYVEPDDPSGRDGRPDHGEWFVSAAVPTHSFVTFVNAVLVGAGSLFGILAAYAYWKRFEPVPNRPGGAVDYKLIWILSAVSVVPLVGSVMIFAWFPFGSEPYGSIVSLLVGLVGAVLFLTGLGLAIGTVMRWRAERNGRTSGSGDEQEANHAELSPGDSAATKPPDRPIYDGLVLLGAGALGACSFWLLSTWDERMSPDDPDTAYIQLKPVIELGVPLFFVTAALLVVGLWKFGSGMYALRDRDYQAPRWLSVVVRGMKWFAREHRVKGRSVREWNVWLPLVIALVFAYAAHFVYGMYMADRNNFLDRVSFAAAGDQPDGVWRIESCRPNVRVFGMRSWCEGTITFVDPPREADRTVHYVSSFSHFDDSDVGTRVPMMHDVLSAPGEGWIRRSAPSGSETLVLYIILWGVAGVYGLRTAYIVVVKAASAMRRNTSTSA